MLDKKGLSQLLSFVSIYFSLSNCATGSSLALIQSKFHHAVEKLSKKINRFDMNIFSDVMYFVIYILFKYLHI